MDLIYWLKWAITLVAIYLGSNWLLTFFIVYSKRDLSEVSLHEQSNITTVRRENETALYRNFLVPSGFPLTTGLGLAHGYKIRNGNFMDVWKAILEISSSNEGTITFDGKAYKPASINGMAKQVIEKLFAKDDYKGMGITTSLGTVQGFVFGIAAIINSISRQSSSLSSSLLPHYLPSPPRQKIDDLDILVIDSWRTLSMMNQSEKWYKLILVCSDEGRDSAKFDSNTKVMSWKELIEGYTDASELAYESPADFSDDLKPFLMVTSLGNKTTTFNQLNLVSSIAAFIKTFPSGHELSSSDVLTLAYPATTDADFSIQSWHKLLSVLLYGGSAEFIPESSLTSEKLKRTTLLCTSAKTLSNLFQAITKENPVSFMQNIKLSLAATLFSEGVFSKWAQFPITSLDKLRCIYVGVQLLKQDTILSFDAKIPKFASGQLNSRVTTVRLNEMRALFGSRIVLELYAPFAVMGPIAHTNFYDYRILPAVVDSNVTCFGPLSTSLEGKLIKTEGNEELDIGKRQGMLCVRGFTIGRPNGELRLKQTSELSERLAGGEGWMPLAGVFGLWGQDGCLYVYN